MTQDFAPQISLPANGRLKPAICVDVDNVVARTDEVMREVIRLHSQEGVALERDDIVCFDYWKCRDSRGKKLHDKAAWTPIHEIFSSDYIGRVELVDGIADHLRALGAVYEVFLATSRLDSARDATLRWVEAKALPVARDHVLFAKSGRKHELDIRFDVAIDDDREQAYAFQSRGVRSVLLACPWNEVGPGSPVVRLNDWDSIVSYLVSKS